MLEGNIFPKGKQVLLIVPPQNTSVLVQQQRRVKHLMHWPLASIGQRADKPVDVIWCRYSRPGELLHILGTPNGYMLSGQMINSGCWSRVVALRPNCKSSCASRSAPLCFSYMPILGWMSATRRG